jgi:hypothetical protein
METVKTKCCSKCGVEKSLNDFYKNTMCSDGYRNVCKTCCKQKQSEYRVSNNEIINKKKKEYYKENRETILNQKKEQYYSDPKNTLEEKSKRLEIRREKSLIRKKEYQRQYRKNRTQRDGFFRLKYSLRRSLNGCVKNKSKRTNKILGCSWEQLKLHIESYFKPGMSWDNYGIKGWHLDHHYPLASAKSIEDIYRLNHYTNLRPLWWYDNLRKSDKLPEEWLNA